MMDEIGSITARISEIQQRIHALSQPPVPPADPDAPTFNKALTAAQSAAPAGATLPGTTYVPAPPASLGPLPGTTYVPAPPASLGPLPGFLSPLPVSPGAADVVPMSTASASGDYETLIQKYAAQNRLEPSLVKAVIQTESSGNPRCVSGAGAMGLMQLMPDNVKDAGISDPFDPEQNIAAGTKQLAGLLAQYHGDLDLALAGYNAGPGAVRKYGGIPPFTETQNYIHRVKAAMAK